MKVLIETDGDCTRVFNVETGQQLRGVTSLIVRHDGESRGCWAQITIDAQVAQFRGAVEAEVTP
jgi:hypothetical protein